jgi:hypothetical protein
MSELKHINEKVNELLDRIADLKVEKQEMLDCLIDLVKDGDILCLRKERCAVEIIEKATGKKIEEVMK